MVATDGHRLAYVQHACRERQRRCSGLSGAGAAQSDGGDHETGGRRRRRCARCSFAGDDNHLFFEFGPRLLITRKLTGNFPDYERVLPQDNTNIATL